MNCSNVIWKKVNFRSKDEFKEFLENNKEAPMMWGDEMQLQITANMHNVTVKVLTVSPDGKASVRTIKPDPRLVDQSEVEENNSIWLRLKGEHYDTLVNGESPLVKLPKEKSSDKIYQKSQKAVEGNKKVAECHDTEDEQEESNKDKLIKKLRAELRSKVESLKYLKDLYKGCETEIKHLQEEKERWKIQVKDSNAYKKFDDVELEDSAEEETKETDDDGCENWKTVPDKQKSKKLHNKKNITESETDKSCSICGQYVITDKELRAHNYECHVMQYNYDQCDFQASSKSILEKNNNLKHNNKNHEEGEFNCTHCSDQFTASWELKNHIRDDHNTKLESCKYYKQNMCSFSSNTCWNSHDEKALEKQGPQQLNSGENKCHNCHMLFTTRNIMMRHKKLKHIEEVRECYKFQTGDCGFSDKFCWNKHSNKNLNDNEHTEKNQGFHKRTTNAAPPEEVSSSQKSTENLADRN